MQVRPQCLTVQHDAVAKSLVFKAYLQTLEGVRIVSVSSSKRWVNTQFSRSLVQLNQ